VLVASVQLSNATVYPVSTKADLQSRMTTAVPGDTVVVANGTYNFDLVTFTNTNGTSTSAPIILMSQTPSGVVFTGTTRLHFRGTRIVIDGFKFANGNAGTNAVIRFGTSSTSVANYCRITNLTIDNYNSDSAVENEWVGIYGVHNRVDHCTFTNKSNARATVVVWYSSTTYPNPAVSTHHRIDSNYFKGRGYLGENGGETIRIGDSNTSRTDGFNTIEYNLFEDCKQTEPEIISNKSDFNTYRYNTFRNSKGGLTLRHGRYCDVYGNFFIVSDATVTEAYGIRVVDKGHRIFNNYFEAVNGNASGGTSQNRAPINLLNGLSTDTTLASAASGYFPADSCIVAFNTIVDARGGGGIVLGGTTGGTIQPRGIVLANNVVKMATGSAIYLNPSNTALTFYSEGNMYEAPAGLGLTTTGWQNASLAFGTRASGILTAPPVVQDAAVNSSVYSTFLSSLDMQGQTRSSIFDVGADEINGTGPVVRSPLLPSEVGANTGVITAVSPLNRVKNITLYPNPVTTDVIVELDANYYKVSIVIINAKGVVVKRLDNVSGSKVSVNFTEEKPGMYVLQVMHNNNLIARKPFLILSK
jgi:poly(beta-D-mannuronate) lyase